MAANTSLDRYANMIRVQVTETGANAGGAAEIQLGYGVMDRAAMKIIRIESDLYAAANGVGIFSTGGASASVALTSESTLTPAFDSANVIAFQQVVYHEVTAAGFTVVQHPEVFDWSGLPEGGLLVPARPLFLCAKGTDLASAMTVHIRLYFTLENVSDADYIEMLQSRGVFGG